MIPFPLWGSTFAELVNHCRVQIRPKQHHFPQAMTIALISFIFLSVCCLGKSLYDPSDLPVVIFRMDDVVTYFCEDAGIEAINTVIDKEVPIAVGLIANGLAENKNFAKKVAKIAESEFVEIYSHSYLHDDYTGNTYDWQAEDLALADDEIEKITYRRPSTFAPPRNTYDEVTVTALLDNEDINLMSAQCSWRLDGKNTPLFCNKGSNVVAPNITYRNLYMLPTGAVMGDAGYFNDFLLPASLEDTVAWVEAQIENQGFSVIMLHPLEFATDSTCLTIDQDKIDVLKQVIDYGKGRWQFMTFQQAVKYYTGEDPDPDYIVKKNGNDDSAGTSPSELVFAFALALIGGITIISCCCSFTQPERKKLLSCCAPKPAPAAHAPPPPASHSPPPPQRTDHDSHNHKPNGGVQLSGLGKGGYTALDAKNPIQRMV